MKPCRDMVALLGPLLDGELPEDERERIEEHVRSCASCTARQALLAAQGRALREKLAERTAAVDFSALAEGVMARIQRETPLRGAERRRVWGREMWTVHRRAVAALGGLAVAASLAGIVALTPPGGGNADPFRGAQVDEVDFGSHDGAVLELPHDTTVIWLSEDKQ